MKTLHIKFIVTILLLCAGSLCCQSGLQLRTPATATSSPSPQLKGELLIEAGLVYKSGDVKPVSRSEFYLLDDDAERILREAKIKRKGKLEKRELNYFNTYAAAQACVSLMLSVNALGAQLSRNNQYPFDDRN